MDLYSENDKQVIKIYDSLKQVIDPELNINIIDLGLIYSVKFNEETGINISMTLSSKGCPMGDIIMKNMEDVLSEDFPQSKNTIDLVWEPKWTSDFISPKGKKELGR